MIKKDKLKLNLKVYLIYARKMQVGKIEEFSHRQFKSRNKIVKKTEIKLKNCNKTFDGAEIFLTQSELFAYLKENVINL